MSSAHQELVVPTWCGASATVLSLVLQLKTEAMFFTVTRRSMGQPAPQLDLCFHYITTQINLLHGLPINLGVMLYKEYRI